MKLISIFNNKGGVGKTTLTFHLANALAEMGHKTLLMDLDPQCNLTIQSISEKKIHDIWQAEDSFIDDFKAQKDKTTPVEMTRLISSSRTIHFLLKPTEDGVTDIEFLSPPIHLAENLGLIPGRLSMHLYEDKLSRRWSDVYQGDPLAIRTATRIRELAGEYASSEGYEFVLMDTSPSLGMLNKVLISTADGFLVPCAPDLFSVYGIRNIGQALGIWKKEFRTIYQLLSDRKRAHFPEEFVRLLGYTIYNARKYSGSSNRWNLAAGHYNYAEQLPTAIQEFIPEEVRSDLPDQQLAEPIGGTSVMYGHNTAVAMAQKYRLPMWKLPDCGKLRPKDASTIVGNRQTYEATRRDYMTFARDLLERLDELSS